MAKAKKSVSAKVETTEPKQPTKNPEAIILEREAKARLDIGTIEPTKRKVLVALDAQFRSGLQAVGVATLKLGEILFKIREVIGVSDTQGFKGYLATFPNLSRSTAYRWIDVFEAGRRVLPEAVMGTCLAMNVDIVTRDKDNPFGNYAPIIKKIGIPKIEGTGPEAMKRAETFVHEVIVKAKAAGISKKKSIKEVDVNALLKDSFRNLSRNYDKAGQKISFLKKVFGYLMDYAGFDGPEGFSPITVPVEFLRESQRKAQENSEETEE